MNLTLIRKADPVTLLFLGACPALALSIGVLPALGLVVATFGILILSTLVLSLLKKLIPENAKSAVCVLTVCIFSGVAGMLMNAFMPVIYAYTGVYVSILAVSLLMFARADASCGLSVGKALAESLKTWLLFAVVVLAVAAVREFFGCGTIAGKELEFMKNTVISVFAQPAGGFMVFAIALAVVAACRKAPQEKECE